MTTEHKWFPMLFKAELVRALLADLKTETRRIITQRNSLVDGLPCRKDFWAALDFRDARIDERPSPAGNEGPYLKVPHPGRGTVHRIYPRVRAGDKIWVRETWAMTEQAGFHPSDSYPVYRATDPDWSEMDAWQWRPCIFMPRKYSRITLGINSVVPERLKDISEEDAKAEGVGLMVKKAKFLGAHPSEIGLSVEYQVQDSSYVDCFMLLWNKINSKRGFGTDANPFVWVYDFKRMVP